MLTLHDITLRIGHKARAQTLLQDISLDIPAGHFVAVVGPSGCGKSTLLKVVAGVHPPDLGSVLWHGRDLAVDDLAPSDIGYVPQFSIAYEHLTIWESLEATMRLRVAGLSSEQRHADGVKILQDVGLLEIAPRQVRVLSGGEKRRLALALELVTHPSLLLCDEVTSGLDPKSEAEIVRLLHRLSREQSRIVLSVTHSPRHLELYDSVIVLYQGVLAYHGSSAGLAEYFQVTDAEDIFLKLTDQPALYWQSSWKRQRWDHYAKLLPQDVVAASKLSAAGTGITGTPAAPPRHQGIYEGSGVVRGTELPAVKSGQPRLMTPGFFIQLMVLLERRWRIFFRDRSQVWLQLALLLGFPCLVVVFALQGLPQLQNLTMGGDLNVVEQLRETNTFMLQTTRVGSLVSGLIMFQVVLLTLMGSNNSAREIAAERLIVEKEKLGGLRPASYLASKLGFLVVLVAAQSIWMAVFVNYVCRFPGDFLQQIGFLMLVNAAMTAVCLAISSLMKSPEQASLLSVYLVGFQLPLSGAVLALPERLAPFTRPFIAAYWSWSGILQTMKETRFYDAVMSITQTQLAPLPLCVWALVSQVVLGLTLAYIGCRRSRWG